MLSVQEHSIEIDSKFYTVYLAYDVIKIDLIVRQNGEWLVLFVL